MDQDFLADIESLRNAQAKVDELSTAAKPWKDYASQLVAYIVAKHFRDYAVGKHPVSLPDGSRVEFEKGENVAVKEELLEVVFNRIIEERNTLTDTDLAPAEVAALKQLHKLLVWKPQLDKRAYDKLPKFAQNIFDEALQRTLATPKITIKVPNDNPQS